MNRIFAMFSHLWRALTRKRPLFRTQLATANCPVAAGILISVCIVCSAYGYWILLLEEDTGDKAVLAVTTATYALFLEVFALGVLCVRNEVARGTAEALILTTAPRQELILAKLWGTLAVMLVGVLLLPMYCLTLASLREGESVMVFAQGGLWRSVAVAHWQPGHHAYTFMGDMITSIGAFLSDTCLCTLFASCGLYVGTCYRGNVPVWKSGVAVTLGLLVLISLGEGVPLAIGRMGSYFDVPPRNESAIPYLLNLIWPSLWNVARLLIARKLLRRAAENLDHLTEEAR